MGFGLLFIGFLFLYSINYNGVDVLPDFFGFIIIYAAFSTLCKYSHRFRTVKSLTVAGIILSLVKFLWQGVYLVKGEAVASNVYIEALNYVYVVYTAVFLSVLALSVFNISKDVDLLYLQKFSLINMMISPLFTVAAGVCGKISASLKSGSEWISRLNTTASLLMIIALIINSLLIFNCYAKICLEGDENMDVPSGRKSILKNPMDYIEKARKSGQEYLDSKKNNKKHK